MDQEVAFRPTPLVTTLLVAALALSACGGGGGGGGSNDSTPPPQLLTGAFIDSAVEGLRYSTPTRSGMTNALGEFQYLQGETVTFSLGGIQLGSAPGQTQITPFTLAGISGLSSRNQISLQLADGAISGLDRAINIATFLVSLDRDGNPDNGIDLSDWNAILTSANLDFDADHSNFRRRAFSEFKASFAVDSDNEDIALPHLYDSLNIDVFAYQELRHQTTRKEDGDVIYYRDIGYVYDGRDPIVQTTRTDTDGDGVFDSWVTLHLSYDDNGNLSSVVAKSGTDPAFVPGSIILQTYTYDVAGNRLTETYETDNNVDEVIEHTLLLTHTYDARGNRLSTVSQSERPEVENVEVMTYVNYTDYTYNQDDQLLTEIRQRRQEGTEVFEKTYSRSNIYDDTGKLLRSELSAVTFSSIPDLVADLFTLSAIVATFTYDDLGNRATATYDHLSSDNSLTARQSVVFSYDSLGRLVAANSGWDGGVNGVDGQADSTASATLSYNQRGLLIESIVSQNTDANGSAEFVSKHSYSYDTGGNLITDLREIDADGDGRYEKSEEKVSNWEGVSVDIAESIDGIVPSECPLGAEPVILNGCTALSATPTQVTPAPQNNPPSTPTNTSVPGDLTPYSPALRNFLGLGPSSDVVVITH